MNRLLLAIVTGLVGAAVVHIAVVFLIPAYADQEAWTSVVALTPERQVAVLPAVTPEVQPLPGLDPAMEHAVCWFDLDNGPVSVRTVLPDRYWSLSLFDRNGRNLFSLNDRSAGRPDLDLVIIARSELEESGDSVLDASEAAIIVDLAADRGFALFRAFVPGASAREETRAALAAIACDSAGGGPPVAAEEEAGPDAEGLRTLEAEEGGLTPRSAD